MAKAKTAQEILEGWGKIELKVGVPTQHRDAILMLNPVYIIDSNMHEMTQIMNDPLVKSSNDDSLIGRKMISLCIMGIMKDAYKPDEAENYAKGLITEKPQPISPGSEELVAFIPNDLARIELKIGDFKRLQAAYQEINFLADEDVQDFFSYPMSYVSVVSQ